MDLFFICMRQKQRVFVDVGQSSKVSAIQEQLKGILDLNELPTIVKPQLPGDFDGFSWDSVTGWTQLDEDQTLKKCGYTKESALAHKPSPLAFMIGEEEEVSIVNLNSPRPIPEDMQQ